MDYPVGMLADDLTGSNDTGAKFVHCGLKTTVYLDEFLRPNYSDVMVINTTSRHIAAEEAYQKCKRTTLSLVRAGASFIYKKVDSIMRGNVGAELSGVMDASRRHIAVVCPAYPEMGRTLLHGQLHVNGQPLNFSELYRFQVGSIKAADIIRNQSDKKIAEIYIEHVEQGIPALVRTMRKLALDGAQIIIIDAAETIHLQLISKSIYQLGIPTITVGSAGMASALVNDIPKYITPRTDCSRGVLVVCGSPSKIARQQLEYAKDMGRLKLFTIDPQRLIAGHRDVQKIAAVLSSGGTAAMHISGKISKEEKILHEHLADIAVNVIQRQHPGALVLVGGDTALAVCLRLGAWGISLQGEAEPGVPYGLLRGKWFQNLPIITKSGSFGDAAAIDRVVQNLYGNSSHHYGNL